MKKILITLLFAIIFCISLTCIINAKDLYLEEIPADLKHPNDTVTHFIVIDGAEYYLTDGTKIHNFNVNIIEDQIVDKLKINTSELGAKYLTKLILPAKTLDGTTITFADINNDKAFKSNTYFRNCGYLVFPSTVTKINDANEFNGQIRCIDFGENSQITSIPGSFMQNAQKLIRLLNMPKNLDSIGDQAFRNCYSLQGDENKLLYIGARTIGNKAFDNAMTNVEGIVFGANVVSLATESFSNGERPDPKVKFIEFKCDVTNVSFPNCNSGKYTGAFYFGTNDSQRKSYSSLRCIILSNSAQSSCSGKSFKEASGQNVYFNDTVGNNNIVTTSHSIDINNDTIFYNSFIEEGIITSVCSTCGATETKVAPALFKYEGISTPENGDVKLTIGFKVNNSAIENYERITKNTVKFGIVAAAQSVLGIGNLPLNDDASAKNNVIKAAVNIKVVSYEFIIVGFETEEHKALKLLLATYVEIYDKDNNLLKIEYLQDKKVENNSFVYVSYNDYLINN